MARMVAGTPAMKAEADELFDAISEVVGERDGNILLTVLQEFVVEVLLLVKDEHKQDIVETFCNNVRDAVLGYPQ